MSEVVRAKINRLFYIIGGVAAPLGLLSLLFTLLTSYEATHGFVDSRIDLEVTPLSLAAPVKLDLATPTGEVIPGSLTLTGLHRYLQGLTVGERLTVNGELTVTNGLTVGSGLHVLGRLGVTGGLTVGVVGESAVSTSKTITGSLLVTDVQTWVGGLTVTGSLTIPITGELTVIGGLIVADQVSVAGKLLVRPFTFYLPLVAQNIIVEADNGGFESGSTQWDEYSATNQPLILTVPHLGVPPHTGGWAASFGRRNDEISMISQSIDISRTNACLVFWQWTVANDICNADYGGVGINGKWVDVEPLCAGTSTARWTRRQVNLDDHLGGTSMGATVLNFAVVNDYSVPSTMYIDDIAFYPSSVCPTKADASLYAAQGQAGILADMIGQPIDSLDSHLPRVSK